MAHAQHPLPEFDPPEPSLPEWAAQWFAQYYRGRSLASRERVRRAMYHALPQGLLPDPKAAQWAWWVRRFHDLARHAGLAFTDGPTGHRLDVMVELPWEDFEALCIGQLQMAAADISAVEARLREYIQAHGLAVDVNATMQRWRQAARM